MSRRSTVTIGKALDFIPKHQNLVIAFLVAIGVSFGSGLLIGELWSEGKLSQTESSYRQVPTELASAAAAPLSQGVALAVTSKLTNINTASIKELDSLPGIGLTYAQRIIDGRPYQAVSELASRKIISLSVYNKIKGQLSVE